jgi:transposase
MWNEEKEASLLEAVGNARPVDQATVAAAAAALDVSTRSISAKLRKMGEEVEKAGARARVFSEEQETALRTFLENNEGAFTYAEIAGEFAGGDYTAKQVQGKILSMELTTAVKAAPKKETQKTYSDAEEATFVKLAESGAYLEDIADTLDKSLASVRGKALSLNRTGVIEKIPAQRESHAANKVDAFDALGDKVLEMTDVEIAEAIDRTVRGVRTLITRRGAECKNYKAKKKAS